MQDVYIFSSAKTFANAKIKLVAGSSFSTLSTGNNFFLKGRPSPLPIACMKRCGSHKPFSLLHNWYKNVKSFVEKCDALDAFHT